MEDAVAAFPSLVQVPPISSMQAVLEEAPLHFFGVYDGHGGAQVANYCADRLHNSLAKEIRKCSSAKPSAGVPSEKPVLDALSTTFNRLDAEVSGLARTNSEGQEIDGSEPIAAETVGTTAVAALIGGGRIVVANCGDSRAVLSRGGEAVPLSTDHKPDREDEMARVESAGGRVIFWNGYRVLGVLAMSRAIGDRYLKPYVISEPEVTCTDRTKEDECLILASDGLWDVVNNREACDIARRCLKSRRRSSQGASASSADPASASNERRSDDATQQQRPRRPFPPSSTSLGAAPTIRAGPGPSDEQGPAAVAAAVLTKVALARGSGDNISVVVVDLQAGLRDR